MAIQSTIMERLHLDKHHLLLRHNLEISLQKIETETCQQQKLLNLLHKMLILMQIELLVITLLVSNYEI